MSLDVYLELDEEIISRDRIFIREDGRNREISQEEWDEKFPDTEPYILAACETRNVFHWNITHNLNKMASEAGVYKYLWRPEEVNATKARQLIKPLDKGLKELLSKPEHYKQFNPPNGWGTYEGLVDFIEAYIAACQEWPDAKVKVWR